MHYIYLLIAVLTEVMATSTLKATEEFTRLWPSVIVLIGYAASFYFLALSLGKIPLAIAYASWAGLGITLVAIVGVVIHKQILDIPAVAGIILIISGVIIINMFSKSVVR